MSAANIFRKLGAFIARGLFAIAGWQVAGELPQHRKFILVMAPHTSNWDFFLMLTLGARWEAIWRTRWLGKHTIFVGWIGRLLRALGGVPIDRGQAQHVVQESLNVIAKEEDIILALAPEGTRKWTPHWKSGFYVLALKSGLPIALGFINYKDKILGITKVVQLSGDKEKDWQEIRDFYQKEWAKHPAEFGEVRPRENA